MGKKHNIALKNNYPDSAKWILFCTAATTLYFNTGIQDPFNPPKFWVLILVTSWITGIEISKKRRNNKLVIHSKVKLISFLLILFLSLSTIISNDKYVSFFGYSQRKTGFFTYLILTLIFLYSVDSFKLIHKNSIYLTSIFVGLILSIYALLQISGIDFVHWDNPYNAIISTLGNPNFAAAVMAITATILFGVTFDSTYKVYLRVISLVIFILLFSAILLSQALQGLLSLALGCSIILIVIIYSKSRRLGLATLLISVLTGIVGILGILQVGPLTSMLYKSSVTVRGYYWRAGVEMFKTHILFGVGPDRYGDFFKEYREVGYPLKYGYNITSTNAHNVPIQFFATGGILVGITYLLLVIFIGWRGLNSIIKSEKDSKLIKSVVFGAWVAYQAQSFVSIDNLGIAIWGWVLGGVVVALSCDGETSIMNEHKNIELTRAAFQPIISSALTLLMFIFCSILYRGEVSMYQTRQWFNPTVAENKIKFHDYALKTINTPLVDPEYRVDVGSYLGAMGFTNEALQVLTTELVRNPRNLDLLNILANYNEQLDNLEYAINYRLKIQKYDPWNAENLVQLGRNYKKNGKLNEANIAFTKVLEFAPGTEVATTARAELIS